MAVAFWTSRSKAWRRASSSNCVYSWISPPTIERSPANHITAQAPAPHDHSETLSERLNGAVSGDIFGGGDVHAGLPTSQRSCPQPGELRTAATAPMRVIDVNGLAPLRGDYRQTLLNFSS